MRGHFPLGHMIPPKHFVRFYDDDNALIKEITYFIKAGLVAGQGRYCYCHETTPRCS